MISKEQLAQIAKLKGLSLGNAEKDYLIELALLSISKNTKDELIFKGGTCLYKFYKLDRFSEDLDFTAAKPINVKNLMENIVSDLSKFQIEASPLSQKEVFNTTTISIRTKGPLYANSDITKSRIDIDINKKSKVELAPKLITLSSLYPQTPNFDILAMDEKEILAEKIRAIITRDKARDLYDLWFLLKSKVEIDKKLLQKKLNYYNLKFSKNSLSKNLQKYKKIWQEELKPFLKSIPDFEEVEKFILSKLP